MQVSISTVTIPRANSWATKVFIQKPLPEDKNLGKNLIFFKEITVKML